MEAENERVSVAQEDDDFQESDYGQEDDEVIGADSDTDDEEWRLSVANIMEAKNERERQHKQLLDSLIQCPIVNDSTGGEEPIVVGTRFPSRESFRESIRCYAVANGRDLKVCVSNKNIHGRVGVQCIGGCPFKVYASFHEKKGCYMAKPHWSTKEIQDAVKEKFKILVTKWFAYKAKSYAHNKLHGSMKEHYSKIGSYLEALRNANAGSAFEIRTVPPQCYGDETSNNDYFLRLFVCFDGLKKGFLSGCWKMLCLDGCFLKTFLGGMLLAAIGRDANDQMFPVAWALVEAETTLSWTWFMAELKKCLGVTEDGKGWTLISDQQKGLLNAVVRYWPNANHRNCARHIYDN